MKRLLTTLALGGLTLPALAALEVGDAAPLFTAQASLDGQEFTYNLEEALQEGPVVVYFYPSAYTQGCNIQARSFAINMPKFEAVGASVVGVSLDSIERLNDFSADPDYCAGELPVASDPDGSIAASYELEVREAAGGITDTRGQAIDHGFAERTTFIVGQDGQIAATVSGVAPEVNVEQALAHVQHLNGN